MHTFKISESTKLKLEKVASEITKSPYKNNFNNFYMDSVSIATCLSNDLIKEVLRLRVYSYNKGILLIKGFPVDTPLMNTPFNYIDLANKKTFISESLVIAISVLLGTPFTYDKDSHEAVVRSIFPHKIKSESGAAFGAQQLGPHTDMACLALRPDYIILFCLRNTSNINTYVSNLSDIVYLLDSNTINELSKPNFAFGLPESLRVLKQNNMLWSSYVPILSYMGDYPQIRYNSSYIKTKDRNARYALLKLNRAIEYCKLSLCLKPGNMLILNNRKCVHSRNAYPGNFDGKDRWLHQVYVNETIQSHRFALLDNFTLRMNHLLS